MEVLNSSDFGNPVELNDKLEQLRIILCDGALVEGADEKQYQILEGLRLLGVEFKSAAVEPGRRPIPSPQSQLRGLWHHD